MRKLLILPILLLSGLILAVLGVGVSRAQSTEGFQIVVHTSVDISALSRDEISKIFLKKRTKWDNGSAIEPVDQLPTSTVRERFSEAVHNRSASAIKSFWQKQIFSGRGVPPQERASDSEVLDLVRSTPGAIGYVSRGAAVSGGVKVVEISG